MTVPTDLIARAVAVARGPIAEHAASYDRSGEFPRASIEALRDAGLLVVPLPVELGGAAPNLPVLCRILEEIGSACASTALILVMHWTSLLYMSRWCDDPGDSAERDAVHALRQRVVDAVHSGGLVASCYGEPGSGSNLATPFTRATRQDDTWVVDGIKLGSFAGDAAYLAMHARVASGSDAGAIVQFIVPAGHPGVRVVPLSGFAAVRGAAPARVVLNGCCIPDEMRFAPVGWFIAAGQAYPYASLLLAAPYVGVARAALEAAGAMLANRTVQGTVRPRSEHADVQRAFGELVVDFLAARSLLERAAAEAVPNPPAQVRLLAEAAKAHIGDMALRVTSRALQLCGARALATSLPLERLARDALAAALHPPPTPEALLTAAQLFLGSDPFASDVSIDDGSLPDDRWPR